MRPKDIRGSLPEYFHDFLFDSVAEGYCQSCWIKLSEWNSVFAFTFFYKAKAHYFLRWCFRVPSLELIYLLLRCPGGGKEIGTYLYHITILWSVEWIGGWGISCDHAVLLNCFFHRSAVSSRLTERGLFMIRLVPDWATWAFTVFPPSPQTSASQSRWAYACRTAKRTVGCSQTRHLYIHTHATHKHTR